MERKAVWQSKKKPGPRPGARRPGRPPSGGKNAMIAIRWQRPLIDGIDQYAKDQMLSRPVALRQIVTRFLAQEGIIDPETIAL